MKPIPLAALNHLTERAKGSDSMPPMPFIAPLMRGGDICPSYFGLNRTEGLSYNQLPIENQL
jgi:hypothetical protein